LPLLPLKTSQLSGATESQLRPLLQVVPMLPVPTSPVTPTTASGRQKPTGSGKFAHTMPEGHWSVASQRLEQIALDPLGSVTQTPATELCPCGTQSVPSVQVEPVTVVPVAGTHRPVVMSSQSSPLGHVPGKQPWLQTPLVHTSAGGEHCESAVQATQLPDTQARPPVHCALELQVEVLPVVPLLVPEVLPEVVPEVAPAVVEPITPEVTPLVAPTAVEVELVEAVEVVARPVVPDVATVPVVVACPVVAVVPVEARPVVEVAVVPIEVPVVAMVPELPVVESTQNPFTQVALRSEQSLLRLHDWAAAQNPATQLWPLEQSVSVEQAHAPEH
jgi:hypothetical protein